MQYIEIIPQSQSAQKLAALRARAGEVDAEVTAAVAEILENVRKGGDAAVKNYTARFDSETPAWYEVPRVAVEQAAAACEPAFMKAIKGAAERIGRFHRRQKQQSFISTEAGGVLLGQRVRALKRVGVYVPGGTAAYPSSVLMNVIPAKIAGVEEIIMVTPPQKDGTANPDILAAAAVAGVDRVFLIGGAQSIAALAYGTETIPAVDKIVGPGNIYVATAKKMVYSKVDIDMVAGPSEILIMADETANPEFLAADLLGQAEHDVLASAILLTTDLAVAQQTAAAVARQLQTAPRREIIEQSLRDYGAILLCDSLEQMIGLANDIAPEHLEVQVQDAFSLLGRLDNAGSVFFGAWSPESLGDYYAGPNHVLPTAGTARFFSPLSVDSFVKKVSYISYTKEELSKVKDDIILIARREGLEAHANSVRVRFEGE